MADDDWEDLVIETGVDTLLNYLAENGEAPTSKISDDLGVSEDRIKEWAKALEDNGFIEKTYSARKGMVLHYTQQNKEEAEKKLEKVKQDVEKKTEKVQKEMESRSDEIEEAKKQLKELSEDLEENREEEEEVKQNLEELEEMEQELEKKLEEQREKKGEVKEDTLQLVSQIDNTLNRIDEAEEKAEDFEKEQQEIQKKMKALKKLEEHSQNVEEMETELKSLEEENMEAESVFEKFKQKLGNIVKGPESEDLLEKPVDEIKEKVKNSGKVDVEELLELEKENKNRKTLIEFLKRRVEEDE